MTRPTRRSLIAMLTGGAAAALAPEELLWVPGRKLISIPSPRVHVQIITTASANEVQHLIDWYWNVQLERLEMTHNVEYRAFLSW